MEILTKIFESLNGCTARVFCGGLSVEGSMEREVSLEYKNHLGLVCLDTIEWNYKEVVQTIHLLIKKASAEMQLSYATRNDLLYAITPELKNILVKIATISLYGVKDFDMKLNDKNIPTSMEITYKCGSIVKLYAIKFPDKKVTE